MLMLTDLCSLVQSTKVNCILLHRMNGARNLYDRSAANYFSFLLPSPDELPNHFSVCFFTIILLSPPPSPPPPPLGNMNKQKLLNSHSKSNSHEWHQTCGYNVAPFFFFFLLFNWWSNVSVHFWSKLSCSTTNLTSTVTPFLESCPLIIVSTILFGLSVNKTVR